MDEWGIDGAVNLSGMYPGPPRNMLETQLAAAAETHGRIAVFANANFRLVRARHKDYGKAMAEELVESKRLGAVGLKIPKGLGLGYPAPDGKHLLPVDDHGPGSAVREGRRAGHADRDPHRRSQGLLEAGHARQRALGRAAAPTPSGRSTASRSRPGRSSTTPSSAAWRATRRPPSSPCTSATIPRIRSASPRCSTSTPTSSSTRPRASPRSAATTPPTCAASTRSTRTASCSAPTPASAPTQDDMMYGSNGPSSAHARRRGPLLHVDLALLRDARQAVREPHAHPGPLEDRRRRPARRDPAQDLLRERREGPAPLVTSQSVTTSFVRPAKPVMGKSSPLEPPSLSFVPSSLPRDAKYAS